MNKRMQTFLTWLIFLILTVTFNCTISFVKADTLDVTGNVENLGNPFTKAAYARNVWDIQVFNNRVYVSNGDSVSNAGTDGIIYYDPVTGKFVNQFKVDEEQLGSYKIIGGQLYLPGPDATESWDFGNFYRLSGDNWTKYRTIPGAIHVFAMEEYAGYIFAGIGTNDTNVLLVSADNGLTWKSVDQTANKQFNPSGGKYILSLFKLNNKLYGASTLYTYSIPFSNVICIAQNQENGESKLTSSTLIAGKMFPGAPLTKSYRLIRPSSYKNTLLYIAGAITPNEAYTPQGLYSATDINVAKRIELPDSSALPMDILDRGNTAYVLAYKKISDKEYVNIVYSSTDGLNYTESFRFTQNTFARSFEELNGDFYFGMGCLNSSISESSGKILRVKSDITKVPSTIATPATTTTQTTTTMPAASSIEPAPTQPTSSIVAATPTPEPIITPIPTSTSEPVSVPITMPASEPPLTIDSNGFKSVSIIGNPFTKAAYARNVWDMQVFNNRVYVSNGDSVENTGTDGVIYYDPATGKFVNQFTVDEEQLSSYKIIGGQLYLPGPDAKESWDFGNFYRLNDDKWAKYRTIPGAIHVFAMEEYAGYIFAGIGTDDTNVLIYSSDNGLSWKSVDETANKQFNPTGGKYVLSLFKLNNKLYGASTLYPFSIPTSNVICIGQQQENGVNMLISSNMIAGKMFPEAPTNKIYRLVRPTSYKNMLLYIAGAITPNEAYTPQGLYSASDINVAKRIVLPESSALPMDILDRGNSAYVLAYIKVSDKEYVNIVYSSTDGLSFTEYFRFTQDTFARSFEELNGDFYFGLGCLNSSINESSGNIIKVTKN